MAKTRWLVLIVGMRALVRPRRQETKQASKARKRTEQEAQKEEEEQQAPMHKTTRR